MYETTKPAKEAGAARSSRNDPRIVAALATLAAIAGIVLIARPTDSTAGLARLIGVGLVLLGATCFVRSRARSGGALDRVDGSAWTVVGVGAIVWPGLTVRELAIVIGATLIVTGAIEMTGAIRGRADERVLMAIGATSSVLFGVAAIAWPTATTLVVSVLVGARVTIAAAQLAAQLVHSGAIPSPGHGRHGGWRLGMRVAIGLAGVLVAGLAATVSVAVSRAQPDEPGSFYDAPDTLPGPAGTLIRSEVVAPFITGATAFRVLYVTSSLDGSPTTSSGLVIVPDGEPPVGGRPVLAFTHGTIGIARRCAPSLLPGDVYGPAIPGLHAFLDAGFVVAATDYAGLGSEATTGYLVGASEAYSTLDGVRAAVELPEAGASPRFATFGESQGGHAALFTGQYAASYAPELELVGVAAAAPATDLTALFQENVGTTFGDVLASFALRSWADLYDVDLADIVDQQAVPVIDRLAEHCLQDEAQMLAVFPEAELLKIRFLTSPPWDTEPWATIIDDNTPGGTLINAPVLIAQGAADPLVVPTVQQAFVDRWCERGQPLEYRTYDGVGHLDAGHATASDVAEWMTRRLAGDAASATCTP